MNDYLLAPTSGNPVHTIEETCEKCIYLGSAKRNDKVYDLWFHYEDINNIHNTVLIIDGEYLGSYRSGLDFGILDIATINTKNSKIENNDSDLLYLEALIRIIKQSWFTTTGFSIPESRLKILRMVQKRRLKSIDIMRRMYD